MTHAPDRPPSTDVETRAGTLREQARALFDQGQFAKAEALYARLTRKFPSARRHRIGYARAAIEACRALPDSSDRRDELTRYVVKEIAEGGTDDDRFQALRMLAALSAQEEGRELLLKTIAHAGSIKDVQSGLQFIPRFVEQGERGALWNTLLARLGAIGADAEASRERPATELSLRLLLALERFPEFVASFDASRTELADSPLHPTMSRIRDRLASPRADVFAEPKVFGIGLSRTGTTSLAQALTLLGIDTAHWTNPLTHQVISDIDMFLFGACTDCCVSPEFEKLSYLYPNARFVLTRRPIETWVESFWRHHERISWVRDMDGFRRAYGRRAFRDAAIEFALYAHHSDVTQSYVAFERRVEAFFADKPAGRLLKLDLFAGQGWAELCEFLEKPVPDAPFPKLNSSA
jgi:hypothetical protein